jgi:hypothetical protein
MPEDIQNTLLNPLPTSPEEDKGEFFSGNGV